LKWLHYPPDFKAHILLAFSVGVITVELFAIFWRLSTFLHVLNLSDIT